MIKSFHSYLIFIIRIVLISSLFLSHIELSAQNSNKDSLLSKFKVFKNLPKQEKNTKENINLLNELSAYYRFRNPDSLNMLSKYAFELSKELKYGEGVIIATIRQGDYYSDIGKVDEAQKFYNSAGKLLAQDKNPGLELNLLKSLSLNFFFNGNLKEGFDASYKAITIAKENSLIKDEATLRHNLGYIYWSNKLYDEAEIEYLIADSLWSVQGKEIDLALTKSNIALNALDKGNLEIAKIYLKQSIDVLSKTDNILWLSRTYRVKSRYFIEMNTLDSALVWISKSDNILQHLYNPRDKLQILEIFSEIYFRKKSQGKTTEYSSKLYALAMELNDSKALKKSYFYLKELEYSKSDFKKMISYQRAYDSLQLKLDETNKVNNLKFLRAKLEYDREQIEINAQNEKRQAKQRTINRIGVFLLFVTAIIGFLIWKNHVNQRNSNRKLKEINETKNKIFSIIGHDLKTPLTTLHELLELFKKKAISPKEMLELTPKIQNSVDYSTFTLNNLLYWAQSQMNGIIANPSEIAIDVVINDTISVFDIKAKRKNIQIENNITQKITGKFDHEHLRIILRNILCNAIKFTPNNGKISISSEQDISHIKINISDTGKGYDLSNYDSLLNGEPVISTKGTNDEKGTGLGLSICKELLDKNNSKLQIKLIKPTGSCFTVVLPKI